VVLTNMVRWAARGQADEHAAGSNEKRAVPLLVPVHSPACAGLQDDCAVSDLLGRNEVGRGRHQAFESPGRCAFLRRTGWRTTV
jgi:hypothetical protein